MQEFWLKKYNNALSKIYSKWANAYTIERKLKICVDGK